MNKLSIHKQADKKSKKLINIAVINASRKWCGVDEVFLQNLNIVHPNVSMIAIVKKKSDIATYLVNKKQTHIALAFSGWFHLGSFIALKKIFLQKDIHIAHIHTAKEFLYGILLKKIYTKKFQNLRLITTRHNSFSLSNFIKKNLQKYNAKIIAVSHFIEKKLLQESFSPTSLRVIPNSLPTLPSPAAMKQAHTKLQQQFLKSQLPANDDKKSILKIGYFGRLHTQKGIDAFLKLSSLLPKAIQQQYNMHFFIAGKADNKAFFDAFTKRLIHYQKHCHHRLHYLGFIADKNVGLAYLNFLDVLIIPSLPKWGEPFCLSALQSLAVGTPVVGTPYGALGELIDSGTNGVLLAEQSRSVDDIAKDLAQQLNHLIVKPSLSESKLDALKNHLFRTGSKSIQKRFSADKHLPSLASLYLEVAHSLIVREQDSHL